MNTWSYNVDQKTEPINWRIKIYYRIGKARIQSKTCNTRMERLWHLFTSNSTAVIFTFRIKYTSSFDSLRRPEKGEQEKDPLEKVPIKNVYLEKIFPGQRKKTSKLSSTQLGNVRNLRRQLGIGVRGEGGVANYKNLFTSIVPDRGVPRNFLHGGGGEPLAGVTFGEGCSLNFNLFLFRVSLRHCFEGVENSKENSLGELSGKGRSPTPPPPPLPIGREKEKGMNSNGTQKLLF